LLKVDRFTICSVPHLVQVTGAGVQQDVHSQVPVSGRRRTT
jgi:hypothetical protein